MRKIMYVCPLAIAASVFLSASINAKEHVRTDRYTLAKVEARSDQEAPLTAVITVSLGNEVQSVGDAIREILQGSGYRWTPVDGEGSDTLLNELPLPAVVRAMGPVRLADALDVVAGEPWGLVVNEVNRTVWFELVSANDKRAKR